MKTIQIKRIYDDKSKDDGYRVFLTVYGHEESQKKMLTLMNG